MELGTVSAFLECFIDKEKMVIWIDVHADVNTREASKSGHYPTRMPVLSKYHIRCISTSQVTNNNPDDLVARFIGEHKYVHISSDVDSINPETEIPSIGITAKGGLTFVQIKTFIRTIAKYN